MITSQPKHQTKGRTVRVSVHEVTCGAHGCNATWRVSGAKEARTRGWHYDKRGGYGWICPNCARPSPSGESTNA